MEHEPQRCGQNQGGESPSTGQDPKRARVNANNKREREDDDDDEKPTKKRQIVRIASGKAFQTVTVDEDDGEVKWH